MDALARCRRAVEDAQSVVAAVRSSDLDAATPCSEWDARALMGHMTGVCQAFAGALRDGTMDASVAQGGLGLGGDDPGAAYRVAADDVMREWEAPGALDRMLQLPLGPTPAEMAIRIFTADQLIHAWDLAKALGRPHRMDEDIAAQTLEMMHGLLRPEMRGPSKGFDEARPVADDASVQDRVLAFSGRAP